VHFLARANRFSARVSHGRFAILLAKAPNFVDRECFHILASRNENRFFRANILVCKKYIVCIIYNLCFLPFYLLPLVSKFRGVFGGRKLFLPGHFGLILDGRVETAVTSRTRRPSATRVANKNKGSRSCTARSAPPRRRPASWTGCAAEARWPGCLGTGPGSNAWSASNTAWSRRKVCPTHAGARGFGEAHWRVGLRSSFHLGKENKVRGKFHFPTKI